VPGCTLQQSPTSDCNSSDVKHSWSLNCQNFALGLIQCDLSILHLPQTMKGRIFSVNGSKTIEKTCPNFALSRHRKWANRRKHQHDAARVLISMRGNKMPTVNEIAKIGGLSQRAANVGKMAGICFATMGSGVRATPGPTISFRFISLWFWPSSQSTWSKPCDPRSDTSGHHVQSPFVSICSLRFEFCDLVAFRDRDRAVPTM
jgi:hypothetical protein